MKHAHYVRSICTSCKGTGVYSGLAEPSGSAVVCIYCVGTGCEVIPYTPFVERKLVKDIKRVGVSRGCCLPDGVGAEIGTEMTYAEFLKKYNK